jgi:hypothetical protein
MATPNRNAIARAAKGDSRVIRANGTAYFVVDDVFSHVTRPIMVWLAKKQLLEGVRRWITSLRPYPSLAFFAVPGIILESAKPLAVYLLGTGHFFLGAVTFITAEVLKLTLVERLFQLNRKKLLSVPAFGWGYRFWRNMMDVVESMKVWQASRRLVANADYMVRTRWLQLKQARVKQSWGPYPFPSIRHRGWAVIDSSVWLPSGVVRFQQDMRQVRNVPIPLQASFLISDRKFQRPLMRFGRGDVRKPHRFKNHHGPSYRRYKPWQRRRRKINLRRLQTVCLGTINGREGCAYAGFPWHLSV